ncbi:MAG: hypothetical protein FD143_2373 [Ignavibacteria bacterium]|nr:MAG: hypothetical protein FD143_2373 [Ignavibacteria bacterium]
MTRQVYVTGRSVGSGTFSDYATIKYNSNGIEQWVQRYNGPGNSSDDATAISVDGSGNVYVTGRSSVLGTSSDYATIKYNSNGIVQWGQGYNGPGNSDDEAIALTVDGSGNIYVTGRSVGSGTSSDYATIKYNSNGIEQWVQRYNGPGNSNDAATAISVDDDYATIKYNSNGIEQWVQRYNGPGNSEDWATAISVDGSGNVYVTGESAGSGTYYDYATIKYNSNGLVQWVQRYNGPGNSDDYARAISVDGSGNVYVTGTSTGNGWSIYTTIKYTQQPVSVEDVKTDLPVTYNLFQNYPNPFNPTTKIKFALLERENVNLSIYSLLGEKVAELINMEMDAGYHEADWNASKFASGVYFYQIKAGSFIRTKKLLLLK